MAQNNPHEAGINAFVGTETGLLKSATIGNKSVRNHPDEMNYGKPFSILGMCWDDKNPKRFHMGLRNLMVKTYDTEERRYGIVKFFNTIDLHKNLTSQISFVLKVLPKSNKIISKNQF